MNIRIESLYTDLGKRHLELQSDTSKLQQSRTVVEAALQDGNAYYGINTGFGALAGKRVSSGDLKQLQRNLILSHAVGVGNLVPKEISRLMLQLKVHALALGYSGISEETFSRLMLYLEKDWIPTIPEKGSVGASGDLAPLAHMSLPLLGHGSFWNDEGTGTIPAGELLGKHGLEPIDLQPKDGLSLINGTQLMSAYGAWVLEKSLHLLKTADLVSAMSLEALQGSLTPFDERIHKIRPHRGQTEVAENVRSLLMQSEILESHRHCGKVQDPYCLRCVPQVHGASRDAIRHAISVVETEINSVTDNPLVFPDGDILSGGNFHGQPLALVLDFAKIALAEIASISERRTYLLLEGHDGLPQTADAGNRYQFRVHDSAVHLSGTGF
jgi:histidine ammonia-lyase